MKNKTLMIFLIIIFVIMLTRVITTAYLSVKEIKGLQEEYSYLSSCESLTQRLKLKNYAPMEYKYLRESEQSCYLQRIASKGL